MQKTMVNPRDSGTLEILFFVKTITLKCFFHMIRGARNTSRIHQKSMSNPTCEKVSKKHEQVIQNGTQNPSKIDKKGHRNPGGPTGRPKVDPGRRRGAPGVPPGRPGDAARPMGERPRIPATPPRCRFNSRLELARATRARVLLIRPTFGPPLHFLSSTSKALRTITAEKVVRSKSI